jgi:GNAT superfamily N-acetyltransferase
VPAVSASIRQAVPADRPALTDMLLRCTRKTRYRRFHGFIEAFPEPYLTDALSGRPGHLALVAEMPGRIVALASCCDGELGILVEDAYQRRGIGRRLLTTLLEFSGHPEFLAVVQHDQLWIIPVLSRLNKVKVQIS